MFGAVKTAHSSQQARRAITCSFFDKASDRNLVVASLNRIWVYRLNLGDDDAADSFDPDSASCFLERLAEYTFEGEISDIASVSLPPAKSSSLYASTSAQRDSLAIAFKDAKLSLVEYDPLVDDLATRSMHFYEEEEFIGPRRQWAHQLPRLAVDPSQRCLTMRIYDTKLVVVGIGRDLPHSDNRLGGPTPSGQLRSFCVDCQRVQDETVCYIQDMHMLQGYHDPTVVLLCRRNLTGACNTSTYVRWVDACFVVTLSLDLQQRTFHVVWSQQLLPSDAARLYLVPEPIGGMLLLSTNSLIYLKQSFPSHGVALNAFGRETTKFALERPPPELRLSLDGGHIIGLEKDKCLVSAADGLLYVLTLEYDAAQQTVKQFHWHLVAQNAYPSCMVHLSGSYVFLAARLGHSRLLRYWIDATETLGGELAAAKLLPPIRRPPTTSQTIDEDEFLFGQARHAAEYRTTLNHYRFGEADQLVALGPFRSGALTEPPAPLDKSFLKKTLDRELELLTTSGGAGADASVCVLRQKVRPEIRASMDVAGVRDVFAVGQSLLLVSMADSSKAVVVKEGKLEEWPKGDDAAPSAVIVDEPTHFAAPLDGIDGAFLQVTSRRVRLRFSDSTGDDILLWEEPKSDEPEAKVEKMEETAESGEGAETKPNAEAVDEKSDSKMDAPDTELCTSAVSYVHPYLLVTAKSRASKSRRRLFRYSPDTKLLQEMTLVDSLKSVEQSPLVGIYRDTSPIFVTTVPDHHRRYWSSKGRRQAPPTTSSAAAASDLPTLETAAVDPEPEQKAIVAASALADADAMDEDDFLYGDSDEPMPPAPPPPPVSVQPLLPAPATMATNTSVAALADAKTLSGAAAIGFSAFDVAVDSGRTLPTSSTRVKTRAEETHELHSLLHETLVAPLRSPCFYLYSVEVAEPEPEAQRLVLYTLPSLQRVFESAQDLRRAARVVHDRATLSALCGEALARQEASAADLTSASLPNGVDGESSGGTTIDESIREVLLMGLGVRSCRPHLMLVRGEDVLLYETYTLYADVDDSDNASGGNRLQLAFHRSESIELFTRRRPAKLRQSSTSDGGVELSALDGISRQLRAFDAPQYPNMRGLPASSPLVYAGVFVCTYLPHWLLMTRRGALRAHPMDMDGRILAHCFLPPPPRTTADSDASEQEVMYAYVNGRQQLRLAAFDSGFDYDNCWPYREILLPPHPPATRIVELTSPDDDENESKEAAAAAGEADTNDNNSAEKGSTTLLATMEERHSSTTCHMLDYMISSRTACVVQSCACEMRHFTHPTQVDPMPAPAAPGAPAVGSIGDPIIRERSARDGPDVIFPVEQSYCVTLLSMETYTFVDEAAFRLQEQEHVAAARSILFRQESESETRREYFVLGTILCLGEDVQSRGRVVVIEVQRDKKRQFRLREVTTGEQKGPVTAICGVNGLLCTAIGQRIFIWALKGSALVGQAFVDSDIYTVSMACVKNLIVAADVKRSLSLLRYQERFRTLGLISHDRADQHLTACEFCIDGAQLSFLATTRDRDLLLMSYEPDQYSSSSGGRLAVRAECALEQRSAAFVRARCKAWDPTNERAAPLVLQKRHVTFLLSSDGAISYFMPCSERTYRRLLMLQTLLTNHCSHRAGLNAKEHRRARDQNRKLPAGRPQPRPIADLELAGYYLTRLDAGEQAELAKKIGCSVESLVEELIELSRAASVF